MNVASGVRSLYDWATSSGPAPIVVVVAALLGGAFLLINGWRQRRHDTLMEIGRASREQRQRMRDRLAPAIGELTQIADEMERLASDLTNRPDDGVRDAPDAIRNARTRLNQVREPEIKPAKDELVAINGRLVQWSGVLRGLRQDAHAGRPVSPRLGEHVDKLEDEVGSRIAAIRKTLEDILAALNQ